MPSEDTNAYSGREFVATIDCHPAETIAERIDRLIQLLKEAGFDAECPGWSVMSGILVPVSQVQRARVFLRTLSLDWITAWASEEGEAQAHLFGWYHDKKKEPNQTSEPTAPSGRGSS